MPEEIQYVELTANNLSSYESISEGLKLKTLVPSELESIITTINKEEGHVYAAVIGKKIVGTIVSHHEQKMLHNCGVYARVDDLRLDSHLDSDNLIFGLMNFTKHMAAEAGCYKLMTTASVALSEVYKSLGMKSTSKSTSGAESISFEILGENIKNFRVEETGFDEIEFKYQIIELTKENLRNFTGIVEVLRRFDDELDISYDMMEKALDRINANKGHIYVALDVDKNSYKTGNQYKVIGLINTHFAHRLDGTLISRPENLGVLPDFEKQYIGTYIMQRVKTESAKAGCDHLLFTCKETLIPHYFRSQLFATGKRTFKTYL